MIWNRLELGYKVEGHSIILFVSCNYGLSFQMEQTTGWLEGGMDRSFYRLHYNEIGPVRKQSGLDGKLDKKDGSDRSHNIKGDGTRTWPIGLRSERLDMGEALLGAIICLVCSSEDKERSLEDTGNVTYNFLVSG